MSGSTQTHVNTTAAPKYKAAKYKYERPKMLLLFDKDAPAPEQLRSIEQIYVEEIQHPIAFDSASEDVQVRATAIPSRDVTAILL